MQGGKTSETSVHVVCSLFFSQSNLSRPAWLPELSCSQIMFMSGALINQRHGYPGGGGGGGRREERGGDGRGSSLANRTSRLSGSAARLLKSLDL